MIKLINILKEITVFKPFASINNMYEDMKSIMAGYIHYYGITSDIEITNRGNYYKLTGEMNDGEIYNNLAYDIAKYDGFEGDYGEFVVNNDQNVLGYYNRLAIVFLVKYGLETGLLKLPFHDGGEKEWLSGIYNGGNMLNNPEIKKDEKYRLRKM
jgi:hypothetical protein